MKWTTTSWKKTTARLEKTVWHKWFAWRPVTVSGMTVWLETVERKGRYIDVDCKSIVQYSYRVCVK